MTAERWEIIDEEFISYTGGTAQLISNGECEIHLWERPEDAQLFCDKLNTLNDENEQLKSRCNDYDKALKTLQDLTERKLKENEQLKQDIENLKITIKARETLIDVCEKKFKELGYIITVDDDGYVIE